MEKKLGDQPFRSPDEERKAEEVRKTKSVPDEEAHYDLDGASYDEEGVIVASDGNTSDEFKDMNPSKDQRLPQDHR